MAPADLSPTQYSAKRMDRPQNTWENKAITMVLIPILFSPIGKRPPPHLSSTLLL